MSEIEDDPFGLDTRPVYRARDMPLLTQMELYMQLEDVMPAIQGLGVAMALKDQIGRGQFFDLMKPLIAADPEKLDKVIDICLRYCEVRRDEGWVDVDKNDGMAALMNKVAFVINENFGPLFALKRPAFQRAVTMGARFSDGGPVSQPDGLDWLWRPVDRGYYSGESLFNGSLKIEHIASANFALDVRDENEARARKGAEQKK